MKRPDGGPHDGRDGVVVAGVVDRSNDRLFRIVAVAHEDVKHAWNGFQQKRAGIPVVTGLDGRLASAESCADLQIDETVDRALEIGVVRGASEITRIALQVACRAQIPVEPPERLGRRFGREQVPEDLDKGQASGDGPGIVVGHHRAEGRIDPQFGVRCAQMRDDDRRNPHQGPIAGGLGTALLPGDSLGVIPQEAADRAPQSKNPPARCELLGNVFPDEASVFQHLFKQPERQLRVVGWKAERPLAVLVGQVVADFAM